MNSPLKIPARADNWLKLISDLPVYLQIAIDKIDSAHSRISVDIRPDTDRLTISRSLVPPTYFIAKSLVNELLDIEDIAEFHLVKRRIEIHYGSHFITNEQAIGYLCSLICYASDTRNIEQIHSLLIHGTEKVDIEPLDLLHRQPAINGFFTSSLSAFNLVLENGLDFDWYVARTGELLANIDFTKIPAVPLLTNHDNLHDNEFVQIGKAWKIRFDNKEIGSYKQIGFSYIAMILQLTDASPVISSATLFSAVTNKGFAHSGRSDSKATKKHNMPDDEDVFESELDDHYRNGSLTDDRGGSSNEGISRRPIRSTGSKNNETEIMNYKDVLSDLKQKLENASTPEKKRKYQQDIADVNNYIKTQFNLRGVSNEDRRGSKRPYDAVKKGIDRALAELARTSAGKRLSEHLDQHIHIEQGSWYYDRLPGSVQWSVQW